MINFYVPLEIKNRDFYGRLLLSLEVCKNHGWDVYFGFRGDVNFFAQNYTPGVYHGLATIRNFNLLYEEIKKNGNKISISDEEGLVTYSEKFYTSFKVSKQILKIADAIFTWGDKNKKILENQFPENKKKFFSLGNPRLDLLKKPYSQIYNNEINKIKEKYGRFILICTNFSYTNYFEKKHKYSELLKKRNFFTSNEDILEWHKYEDIKKKIFNELSLFLENANKLKDCSLVIRCHPSENHEIYKKFEKKHKNVFFDNDYSVHPWILASEGIINHYCTTTYEAIVANKNVYTIKPDYSTEMEDDDFFDSTIIAKDNKELTDLINKNKDIHKDISKKSFLCSKNLDTNHLSFKAIAKELAKIPIEITQTKKNYFILKYKILKKIYLIRDLIFFKTNKYVDHKIKIITKNEIVKFINTHEDFKNKIAVEKICKNFFCFKRKSNF